MQAQRPLRYPSFPLNEAVNLAVKIFQRHRQSPMTIDTAATTLGYMGACGSSEAKLGALKHYGLIEYIATGTIKISKLAVEIIYPVNDATKIAALQIAAFKPKLFQAIRKEFPDGKFTHHSLQSFLVKANLVPNTPTRATRVYSETFEFVQSPSFYKPPEPKLAIREARQTPPSSHSHLIREDQLGQFSSTPLLMISPSSAKLTAPATDKPQPSEFEWLKMPLGRDVTVRVLTAGKMGAKEIARLIKMLQIQNEVFLECEEAGNLST